ncbi:MAG: YbaN family protein [Methanobacteriaceae archaeon]|nr:YbaN family protein [Methanobacteriaceae archaeon]
MDTNRIFFFGLGTTLLGIGAIGIVLPVLPTTPFVIASFFCFAKSSKKAERWILSNRYFGSYIKNYQTKQGVPLDVKIKSLIFLWIMLIASMIYLNQDYLFLILILVGLGVSAHILLLKTKKNN